MAVIRGAFVRGVLVGLVVGVVGCVAVIRAIEFVLDWCMPLPEPIT